LKTECDFRAKNMAQLWLQGSRGVTHWPVVVVDTPRTLSTLSVHKLAFEKVNWGAEHTDEGLHDDELVLD
jgi:hypothetical protein